MIKTQPFLQQLKDIEHIKEIKVHIEYFKLQIRNGESFNEASEILVDKIVDTYKNKPLDSSVALLIQLWVIYMQEQEIEGVEEPTFKPFNSEKIKEQFSDIYGADEAINNIRSLYILPKYFPLLYPKSCKGLLLYGPPGTGKTKLARATVGELRKTVFFVPSPGEIKGKYEGETEKNIQAVFKDAVRAVETSGGKYTQAVIIFDEFELLGGDRRLNESMTRSVNTLLQQMDGVEQNNNVSVIAITNYPNNLDDGILRRFSARVFVTLPNDNARKELIQKLICDHLSRPFNWGQKTIDCRKDTIEAAQIQFKSFSTCPNDFDNIVDFLVKKTEPSKKGLNIIKSSLKGELIDPNQGQNHDVHFGYSGSDIENILDSAFRFAANKARISPLRLITIGNETFYIPSNIANAHFTITNNSNQNLKKVDPKDYQKVISFSLCREDIEFGLQDYPSTTDNVKFIELLNYANKK